MKIILPFILLLAGISAGAQDNAITIPADTSALDTRNFAKQIVQNQEGNFAKARVLLNWLSNHFEWTATDYKKRTVKEIIVRKGGNCFELATVYMSLLEELEITHRPMAEVNIHQLSEQRGENAARKVKEVGNRMSVFGRRHNDHRWVEILDETVNEWVPADPTMNIIGFDQWLKGRAWFGERHTLNDEFSSQMIVPFAIFVANRQNSSQMLENRTLYYLVHKLDALYHYKLSSLPSWKEWIHGLERLSAHARKAFQGEEDLHQYNDEIEKLGELYESLRKELQAGK